MPDPAGYRASVASFGLVCPLGGSVEAAVSRLRSGGGATQPLTRFPGPARGGWLSAEAPPIDVAALLAKPKDAKLVSRSTALGLAAVRELLDRPGLAQLPPADRVGVFAASGQTGLESTEFFRAIDVSRQPPAGDLHTLGGRASRAIDPFFSLRTLANAAAYYVGEMAPAAGPSQTFVQGPAASIHAVDAAIASLQTGECDAAIVVAHDCLILPSIYEILDWEGRLGEDAIVPGEAGAAVLLTREESGIAQLQIVDSDGSDRANSSTGAYLGAAQVLADLVLWLGAQEGEPTRTFGVPTPWREPLAICALRE